MSTSDSIQALRRANPRGRPGFARSVEEAAVALRTAVAAMPVARTRPVRRARVVRISAGGAFLALAAGVAAFLTLGSSGGTPGIEDATAAVRKAATLSAASAERSGTAVVRITRNGELWAGTTVRWNGGDLAVSSDAPSRAGKAGSELRLVDGVLYGIEPETGGWVLLGDPASIDPGSGTTPDEYLAAVRADVGGATLRWITDAMSAPSTRQLEDGSVVYSGTVAAGLVAGESSFKGDRPIRVLPFGYVAHDDAADPAAPLAAALTVGGDGIVRQVAVTWGGASTWTYTVTYGGLGATDPVTAPANARPLRSR